MEVDKSKRNSANKQINGIYVDFKSRKRNCYHSSKNQEQTIFNLKQYFLIF